RGLGLRFLRGLRFELVELGLDFAYIREVRAVTSAKLGEARFELLNLNRLGRGPATVGAGVEIDGRIRARHHGLQIDLFLLGTVDAILAGLQLHAQVTESFE